MQTYFVALLVLSALSVAVVAQPQVCGGTVTNVAMFISPAERIPGLANTNTTTFTFTTQTPLLPGNAVTISFPFGFFASGNNLAIIQAAGGPFLACCPPLQISQQQNSMIIPVAGSGAPPGTYSITITGITMGGATLGNTGIIVQTTTDLPSSPAPTGALGGSVQNVQLAGVTRTPLLASQTATLTFVTQTQLIAQQTVTINVQATFGNVAPTISSQTPASSFSPTVGISQAPSGYVTFTLTVPASTILLGNTYTVAFAGLTMGGPSTGNLICVSTTTDAQNCAPSLALGGQVQNPSLTIAVPDRIPLASKQATLSFTTQTQLGLNTANAVISITWPSYLSSAFFSGSITVASATSAFASTVVVSPSGNSGTIAVTPPANGLGPGSYTLTLTGNLGPYFSGSSCGITVSTSTDLPATTATPALGGTVSSVSFNIAPSDRIPTSTNKPATLSFAIQTQLTPNQLIMINWPSSYLSGNSIAVQYVTANVFGSVSILSAGKASIAVGSAGNLMPGSYTVTLTGATIGGPIVASASTGISVSTTDASGNNLIDAAGVGGYPALGGQVSSASFSVAARDRVPSATGKMLTVSFTTQTQLLAGNFVTINYPAGFFGTSNSATVFSPATTFNSQVQQTQTSNTNNFVLTVGNAIVNPGTITVIIQGVTMGPNPRVTPCYVNDVSVSTSTDIQSIVPVAAGSLGGQVQNVALTMSDLARQQPGAPNQQVTITFVTQTDLNPNINPNNAIVISWPFNYLSPSSGGSTPTYQILYAFPNVFPQTATAQSSNGLIISIANNVLIPAGLYTITLSGVTIGPTNPGGSGLAGQPLSISTTQDVAGVAGYPSIGIQNPQVSRVRVTIAPADRFPGAGSSTSKIVTVAFTTQSQLAPNQIVSLQWPSNYLQPPNSGSAMLYYGMSPPSVFPNTISSSSFTGDTGVRITVTGTMPAGTYTLYLVNFILGSNQGNSAVNCNPSGFAGTFSVATYTNNNVPIDQPGYSTYPAIGGTVTNVQLTNAAEDRVAGITGRTATVTFTTQTPLAVSSQQPSFPVSVFILWPMGYMGAYPIGVISPYFANFTVTVPGASAYVSMLVYLSLIYPLPAGTYSVTLTGLTMGGPTAPGSVPPQVISVGTVSDSPGNGNLPQIGGQVTATALQINAADRVASYTNRKVVVSFTTSTSLACGDTITLTVPTNFFSGTTTSYLGIPIATKPVASSNGQSQTFVFLLNGTVAAGPQSITICGVRLLLFPTNQLCGVTVTTSRDYTTVFAQTGIIGQPSGGQVTGVSMVIPWANRIASSTQQTATFTFTTATSMATFGSISIGFPLNFFVPNAPSACGGSSPSNLAVSGIPGYTSISLFSNSFVISGGSLTAGTYTAVVTGLNFGAATKGSDTGIQISTQLDSASVGATSGPLSGFQVTGFSLSSCQILPNTCQSATLSFLSNAGPVTPGQSLIIQFSGSGAPLMIAPSVINTIQIGNAYISGAVTSPQGSPATTITLTVNPNFGAFVPGSSATTITLNGLKLLSTNLAAPGIVSIGNSIIGQSTPLWSAVPVPTSSGLTTTTGLTINDPYIGAQNTQATISFTTMNPINPGDKVVVVFPTGFFINTPSAINNGCPVTSLNYVAAAYSPSSTCGDLQNCQRNYTGVTINPVPNTPGYSQVTLTLTGPQSVQLPAGPNTIVFTGVTMSTTAVAASNSIAVYTSNDACSAGPISSGSISARPPPASTDSGGLTAAQRNSIIAGAVVGSLLGVALIVAVVFRQRIALAVRNCRGGNQQQPFAVVAMSDPASSPTAPNPYDNTPA